MLEKGALEDHRQFSWFLHSPVTDSKGSQRMEASHRPFTVEQVHSADEIQYREGSFSSVLHQEG